MTKGLPPKPVDPRTVVVPPGQPVKARSSSQASPQADRNSQSDVAVGGKARIHPEPSPASHCHAGIGETIATEAEIWRTISAECVRTKELAAQFSGSLPLQSFAETEQKAFSRLGEPVIPSRGLMEFMRSHTTALQRVVEVSKETLMSVPQISTPNLPRMDMGQILGAFDALGALSDIGTINNLKIQERISPDARDVLSEVLTWGKLNESRLKLDETIRFNLMEHTFLQAQLGLPTTGGIHQKISSARIIPSPNNQHQVKPSDLEPKVFTTRELKHHLGCYDEATIRRKANESWKEGAGPQPLKGLEDWYVVGRGNSEGGRRCGWRFQRRKKGY
ncbi:hypothetical protein [Synechococcus sp. Lug-A]|uniref:hypothetical protein n=1 Tax=Synechococcus sp. Lug-A TaxID=2823740 RepID=UPI0020CFD5D1|nr:hypothetical protein [Synechococcus sp. Lug-A]